MDRCLIVVEGDRLDLVATLASQYSEDGEIEIRLDRRQSPVRVGETARVERRAQPRLALGFPRHGFLVIPRP